METRSQPARAIRFHGELRVLLAGLLVFLLSLILILVAIGTSMLTRGRRLTSARIQCESLLSLSVESDAKGRRALDVIRRERGYSAIELRRGSTILSGSFSDQMLTVSCAGRESQRVIIAMGEREPGLRSLSFIALFSLLATLAGVALLLVFVVRLVQPMTEMLDEAQRVATRPVDDYDARYLVDTFRETVHRLEEQEGELARFRQTRGIDLADISGAIGSNFSSGFIALDPEGRFLEINRTGREILGLNSQAEVAGDAATLALPAGELRDVLVDAHASRRTLSRQELTTSSGQVIGLTTIPMNRDGEFQGLLALFTDLTPFRQMETRLRDAQRLVDIGEISAGIAHEVRNSLSTILGYLRLAERSRPGEEVARIRNAQKEAVELSASLEALLRFSRPLAAELERVPLEPLLTRLVAHFSSDYPEIAFVISPGNPVVNGDPHLLARAFENLLRNAVEAIHQAGRSAGRIDVTLKHEPPAVIIRDNGIGIDNNELDRLMLPFQSKKATGFGLGLPLTSKVVLHHGGTLELRGDPEGSTATITFPG